MGALDKGLSEEELPDIVARWRQSNKRIVDLWHTIQACAINCLKLKETQVMQKNIYFSFENGNLVVTLPSKRQLFYINPRLEINQFGSEALSYMGQNQTTKKWERIPTYGGKLTENLVQAIARDCLAEGLKNLVDAGYRPLFHIHDEIISEVPKNNENYSLDNAIKLMCKVPTWAEGLPLNADGFASDYYKKE